MGRFVFVGLLVLFAFWFGGGLCAHRAQAQGVGGCLCVTDALTEYNTGVTAKSVSTSGTATFTVSNAAFSAIDPGSFQQEFPGWVALPINSRIIAATNTEHTLSTYQAAAQDAQAEVAASASLPHEQTVLAAIQAQTVAIQHQTQVLADLVQVEAVEHAEQLNEKARGLATQSQTPNWLMGLAQ